MGLARVSYVAPKRHKMLKRKRRMARMRMVCLIMSKRNSIASWSCSRYQKVSIRALAPHLPRRERSKWKNHVRLQRKERERVQRPK